MRILQVIPAFPPSKGYGGAPTVAYEISKRLVQRGHELVVCTTDANDQKSRVNTEVELADGLKVYYFKNISNSLAYNYKIFISPQMIRFMKKTKGFDVIHIHDFRTIQSVLVYWYSRKFCVPYVLQPHGKPPLDDDPRAPNLKYLFDLLIGKKILHHANKLLVFNHTEAKLYESTVGRDKIEIIPNGINLSDYSHLPEEGKFRNRYGIHDDEYAVLYLGRLHKSKGLDLLIESFSKLSKKIEKIRLIIAGPDDGYLQTLNVLAASLNVTDKIIFTGYLSHEDKLSAYIDSDVFVTPTFYGFPLTFLEAMACGVPIITTDKGDFIEGIDNEVGFVVKYNEEDLENAMFRILTDVELREKLKGNAQKKIKEYDWDRIVDRIEKVYKEVMEKSA